MRLKKLNRNQKGQTLIEVLIAVALLGMIAVAFLGGLVTVFRADIIADERSVAQSLATSQMEYVKSLLYEYGASPSYEQTDVPSPDHPGYTISVAAEPLHDPDDGIQKITLIICRDTPKELLTLEGYKVSRGEK